MRLKTTVLIILIVFFTTVTTFFSGLHFTQSSLQKTMEQDLAFAIGIANSLVGLEMNLKKSEASIIAARLATATSPEELTTRMAEQLQVFPQAMALSVFDRQGTIASYSVPMHDHDLTMHGKSIEMVYNGGTIISSPFYCATNGEFAINVYTPMGSGRILAMTISGLTFSDMLAEHRLWRTGDIFMLNEEGKFIGAANADLVLAMNSLLAKDKENLDQVDTETRSLVQKILATDTGVEGYSLGDMEYLCAYSRIDNSLMGWRVVVTVSVAESPQADALRGQTQAALLFLVIGVAAAFFLSRLAAQPFKRIEAQNRTLEEMNKTILAQAAAIREDHERVQLLLDATPLACRLWNRDFELIDCNEATVRLFQLTNKQEYLDRYFELAPEFQSDGQTTRDKVRMSVTEAFEKGSCTYEWTYRMLDGALIPAETKLVRVPYGNDYVVASYSRDLREQQKMMAEIEQRDALLQSVNRAADILLRSEPDDFSHTLRQCMGIMARAINADRMYLCKNHTENGKLHYTQVYEWSEKVQPFQGTGMTTSIPYDATTSEIKEALVRGESVHCLVRDMSPADRERLGAQGILSVLLVPIRIRNEFWGIVGFDNCHSEHLFTDTEESVMRSGSLLVVNALLRNEYTLSIRDTSAKLEIALADAEEANNAKSSFLAHMSHEIRTPLNAVIGLSELMLGEGSLNRGDEANLEKICGAGSTILSIVNDILDISKIESGKFQMHPVQYDTPSLINDIVALNIVRIGEKIITFKLDVDENLPGMLYGDDLRVKQIFNNLLSNAFKYTLSGTVEWRISFEREGENVWLVSRVSDTGIGIKPEDVQKLFSDYNQVDMHTNRRVGGTGLGLAITKRLVDMMDGTIAIESEYGKGTTLHVRLRQSLVSEAPIGQEVARNLTDLRYTLSKRAQNTNLARVNLFYARVLVVDDIETNLDVARGMMAPYAMNIDCATDGRQAIEMIRAETPRYDAVFMDHMMPDIDGVEATRIIREEIGTEYARNVPIIALTANAVVGNEEMFLRQGFQAFLSKPIDMMKLDAVLRRWIRDKNLDPDLPDLPDTGGSASESADREREAESGALLSGISINGVDKTRALKRFGGNAATFINVLRSYATNTPPLLRKLQGFLAVENIKDYAITVHGIKGASNTIAAQEAGWAAEELERAAKAGNCAAVRSGHAAFAQTVEALLEAINKALSAIDAATGKPVAVAPDAALLQELREACAAYDMDKVDETMKRLESFRYENGGKIVTWLREQVNTMAFGKIFNEEWPTGAD